MASAPVNILPSPQYPDVPQADGVPAVYRGPANPGTEAPAPALTSDSPAASAAVQAGVWGLYYPDGRLALAPTNVVAAEVRREARVSDYPQEAGGFQSYNKVIMPGENRITVTKGGSASQRQAFLDTLDALVASTDLFDVVAPDCAYLDRNLTSYDMRRTAQNGATLLTVELITEEIRQTARSFYSDTKDPAGADPQQDGPVQAVPPTDDQTPAGNLPTLEAMGIK